MGAAREVEPPPAQDEEPEDDEEEEAAGVDGEPGAASPWNIMIKHRLVQRRGRRSQMMTSFTDPVVSMDLLRAVLQPSINEEIQAVFGKYMKFFQKAAGNVRENVGEDVDTEQLIQETCRSCLEQAKLLFCDGKRPVARVVHEAPAIKVKAKSRAGGQPKGPFTSRLGEALWLHRPSLQGAHTWG
ncbi:deoxynucleotidyltransferase terminal-interacting protein 1-like, partial [Pseudonaja textilis]|uniref:deoxynucleotidyltransferase terminal-interacting protein 1-like n=1 Tax=Pseudonaja textilis TaxID=8673 RepID=UPI000EAA25C4